MTAPELKLCLAVARDYSIDVSDANAGRFSARCKRK